MQKSFRKEGKKMSMQVIYDCIRRHGTLTSLEKRVFIEKSISIHSGKMEGIPSISTSVRLNPNCMRHQACGGSICEHCYANAYTGFRKSLREKLEFNTIFYTTLELEKRDIPLINSKYFRFESFGDLINTLQVKNYFTIARANPDTYFVLWTKNPDIIEKALRKYEMKVPSNFRIIVSELYINQSVSIQYFNRLKKLYPFINKLFSVYSPEYIENHKISINCGGKKCLDCMRCYTKSDRTKLINEKLK